MRGAAVHDAPARPVVMAAVAVVEGLVIVSAASAGGRRALCEPSNLQRLRRPDERGEHVLRDVCLSLVHVLDERLQILVVDVVKEDHRLLVARLTVPEHGLEARNGC